MLGINLVRGIDLQKRAENLQQKNPLETDFSQNKPVFQRGGGGDYVGGGDTLWHRLSN